VFYTLYFQENEVRATLKTGTQNDNVVSLEFWTYIDLNIFYTLSNDTHYDLYQLFIREIDYIYYNSQQQASTQK